MLPSVLQKNDWIISTESANTSRINSFLWMRVPSIVGRHIEDTPGQFGAPKHNAKHSLCAANGMSSLPLVSCHFSMLSRFSVLPAISLESGILHCDIIQGSFCTATFSEFIRTLLDNMKPFPASNSVIVLDNCRIHKHPDIQEMIKNRYVVICTKWCPQYLFNLQRHEMRVPSTLLPRFQPDRTRFFSNEVPTTTGWSLHPYGNDGDDR